MNASLPELSYYKPHGHSPGRDLPEVDLCIYGGTAAGVTAALQAARLNLSVIVIEPGNHVGGVTTSGLGCTDFGGSAEVWFNPAAAASRALRAVWDCQAW